MLDEHNTVLVSAASLLKIATKYRFGKLPISVKPIKQFHALNESDGFEHLPMTWQHSLVAQSFNNKHRDPSDRMLAAQARLKSHRL